MGLLKKISAMFGLGHNDAGHGGVARDGKVDGVTTGKVSGDDGGKRQEDDDKGRFRETGLPRKGFGVPVQVAVERSNPNPGPVLRPCAASDGGVQGLDWYSTQLKVDEDGDVADEFVEEQNGETLPKRCKTKSADVKGLGISSDGKLQPLMR